MNKRIILFVFLAIGIALILFNKSRKNSPKINSSESVSVQQEVTPNLQQKLNLAPIPSNTEPANGELIISLRQSPEVEAQASQEAAAESQAEFEDFQQNQQYMKSRQEGLSKKYE